MGEKDLDLDIFSYLRHLITKETNRKFKSQSQKRKMNKKKAEYRVKWDGCVWLPDDLGLE